MPLELATIPCLSDNYAYIAHDPASGATAVADVPEAGAVRAALDARGWQLTDILLTHHHADHVGGVAELREATGARVWGHAVDADRLPALDRPVRPGTNETFAGEAVHILDVPGHTVGHIAYFFADSAILFSGDSLMAMGCGRLFEGSAEEMWRSLQTMAALPDATQVCSGHEYTEANTRFALSVDPDNPALKTRARQIREARAGGHPTLPARLSDERVTNPFLRASDPEVKRAHGMADATDVEMFSYLRRLKDDF